ncbi:hypothetical protein PENTCL1PPCAC_20077, partial [Pristionchus entomophagus]
GKLRQLRDLSGLNLIPSKTPQAETRVLRRIEESKKEPPSSALAKESVDNHRLPRPVLPPPSAQKIVILPPALPARKL